MRYHFRDELLREVCRWEHDLLPLLTIALEEALDLVSAFNSPVDRRISRQHDECVNHALRAGLPRPRRPRPEVKLTAENRTGGKVLWKRLEAIPRDPSDGNPRVRYTTIPMRSRVAVDMDELLKHIPPDEHDLAKEVEARACLLRGSIAMLSEAMARLWQIRRRYQTESFGSTAHKRDATGRKGKPERVVSRDAQR
jgi:hypothetical protein